MTSVSSICLALFCCDLIGPNVYLAVHFCFNPSLPFCPWFNVYTVTWFEWYQFLSSLAVIMLLFALVPSEFVCYILGS